MFMQTLQVLPVGASYGGTFEVEVGSCLSHTSRICALALTGFAGGDLVVALASDGAGDALVHAGRAGVAPVAALAGAGESNGEYTWISAACAGGEWDRNGSL